MAVQLVYTGDPSSKLHDSICEWDSALQPMLRLDYRPNQTQFGVLRAATAAVLKNIRECGLQLQVQQGALSG